MKKDMFISKLSSIMSLLTVFFAVMSCDNSFRLELPLAVDQNELKLDAGGGETHVMVYSTGEWSARLEKNVDWAKVTKADGKGNGEFIFEFDMNPGIARQVKVVIESEGKEVSVMMVQAGFVDEATISFSRKEFTVPSWASKTKVGMRTSLSLALDRISASVEYGEGYSDDEWVEEIRLTESEVVFSFKENTTGTERSATLNLSIEDDVTGKHISCWIPF